MNHTDALNLILSNACPMRVEGDEYTFHVELHCAIAVVNARLISTKDTIQYEILSVEV